MTSYNNSTTANPKSPILLDSYISAASACSRHRTARPQSSFPVTLSFIVLAISYYLSFLLFIVINVISSPSFSSLCLSSVVISPSFSSGKSNGLPQWLDSPLLLPHLLLLQHSASLCTRQLKQLQPLVVLLQLNSIWMDAHHSIWSFVWPGKFISWSSFKGHHVYKDCLQKQTEYF